MRLILAVTRQSRHACKRAIPELLTANGGGALPEATGRFLEELKVAVHQLVDRALDR